MSAWGPFGRRLTWPLVLGAVAVACGGDTTGGGTASLTGGATSLSGGTASLTGGTSNPTAGTANPSGGTATGGASSGGSPTGGTSSGGVPSGGAASGGSATGGASNSLCDIVSSLPGTGTACSISGESHCDSSGNRCVCERGIWYCNDACPASQPTPNTPCPAGVGCSYPEGVSCVCLNHPADPGYPEYPSEWICIGVSDCPSSMPVTGNACNNLTGIACDYPNSNPALHFGCVCTDGYVDAGTGSTWTCIQLAQCPATQPSYDLTRPCPGTAVCTYSNSPRRCACFQSGSPWVCV